MPEIYEKDRLYEEFRVGEPQSKTTIMLVDNSLFDIQDTSTWQFSLDNIATSLSNLCRYNGHIRNFYSVAEHAVRVSKKLEEWCWGYKIQYLGLHHDDIESYLLGDIPSPQKRLLSIDGEPFKYVEETLEHIYFQALGLRSTFIQFWDVVKEADLAVYIEERSERPIIGQGLYPNLAKKLYLGRHAELLQRLGDTVNRF
jgi:hypothetical protein